MSQISEEARLTGRTTRFISKNKERYLSTLVCLSFILAERNVKSTTINASKREIKGIMHNLATLSIEKQRPLPTSKENYLHQHFEDLPKWSWLSSFSICNTDPKVERSEMGK